MTPLFFCCGSVCSTIQCWMVYLASKNSAWYLEFSGGENPVTPHKRKCILWCLSKPKGCIPPACRFVFDCMIVTPPLSGPWRHCSEQVRNFDRGAIFIDVIAVVLYCCSLRIIQRREGNVSSGSKIRSESRNVGWVDWFCFLLCYLVVSSDTWGTTLH